MPGWKKRSRYSQRKGGRKSRSAPSSSKEKVSPGRNAVGGASAFGSTRSPPDGAHEPGGGIVHGTGAMRASSCTGEGLPSGAGSAARAARAQPASAVQARSTERGVRGTGAPSAHEPAPADHTPLAAAMFARRV